MLLKGKQRALRTWQGYLTLSIDEEYHAEKLTKTEIFSRCRNQPERGRRGIRKIKCPREKRTLQRHWQKKKALEIEISWICLEPWKKVLIAQLCPTLCDPTDCSRPGSSVRGIFQARILEWTAISFSSVSSRPRDQTRFSHIAGKIFHRLSQGSRSHDPPINAGVGERAQLTGLEGKNKCPSQEMWEHFHKEVEYAWSREERFQTAQFLCWGVKCGKKRREKQWRPK